MSILEIPVKFQKGDVCYTIKQTNAIDNCNVCEGKGKIKYNDKEMRCPECMGTGKIKLDKNICVVLNEPFVITLTKISITNNGIITVRYKGHCGCNSLNRAEESLFLTKEEAQIRCNELNREKKLIMVKDIIIQESFKTTSPSVDKIQEKLNYYKENNKFKDNIVINKDNVLLDGYINYLICNLLNIEMIKAIIEEK